MAKKPEQDRALIIVGIVGAAAVVGGALYFAFTSQPKTATASQANPTPTPPTTDTASATPPTQAPSSTTFAMQVTGDTSIALKSGESVALSLPTVPAPAAMWQVVMENHDGRAEYTVVDATHFNVIAEMPGVSVLRFTPISAQGGSIGLPGLNITLSIS
jgi:hypothetical protein